MTQYINGTTGSYNPSVLTPSLIPFLWQSALLHTKYKGDGDISNPKTILMTFELGLVGESIILHQQQIFFPNDSLRKPAWDENSLIAHKSDNLDEDN